MVTTGPQKLRNSSYELSQNGVNVTARKLQFLPVNLGGEAYATTNVGTGLGSVRPEYGK